MSGTLYPAVPELEVSMDFDGTEKKVGQENSGAGDSEDKKDTPVIIVDTVEQEVVEVKFRKPQEQEDVEEPKLSSNSSETESEFVQVNTPEVSTDFSSSTSAASFCVVSSGENLEDTEMGKKKSKVAPAVPSDAPVPIPPRRNSTIARRASALSIASGKPPVRPPRLSFTSMSTLQGEF